MTNAADNGNVTEEMVNGFVSSIKIAGVSMLPPVISTKRRLELQNDKKKAIEIERGLNFQKDLQQFFKQYNLADIRPFENKECDKLLDSLLFNDSISQLDEASIGNESETIMPSKIVPLLNSENRCASFTEPNHRKVCDESEIEIILRKLSASSVELDLTDVSDKDKKSMVHNEPGYALNRSKTFILPAPSPVLLKHLKERPHTSPAFYNDIEIRSVLDDLDVSCSSDNLFSSATMQHQDSISLNFESSHMEFDKTDKSISDCNLACSTFNADILTVSNTENININADEALPHLIEEIQSTTGSFNNSINITSEILDLSNADTLSSSAQSNVNAALVLSYVNGILNKSFDENQRTLILDSQCVTFNHNDILSTSTPNLIDFESDNCDMEAVRCSKVLDLPSPNIADNDNLCPLDYLNIERTDGVLFNRSVKEQRRMREKWAAGILTAAAKGYLVRRLKRTEKVQNLIQTIRDALVCALSLHSESTDSIQNSDVELHRRLIQQVSAACYEFYEVFFSLTTKEKMDLIAVDRQRMQDKLKRPRSGSHLKLESNRSTPKSQRRSLSARQTKCYTPTFAA